MNQYFKAVIFDMDGVLADTEPYYQEIEKRLFRRIGLDIGEDEHESFRGVAADLMWQVLKQKYGLAGEIGELIRMTMEEVVPYFRSLQQIEPFEGIPGLIARLTDRRIPLALASSSYPEVINIVLEKTGLLPSFNVVVNSTEAGASKPDPAVFLLAAERLGVEPGDCMVIEDSANGIQAAKVAGMFCVAVDFPGNKIQDKTKADLLITDYHRFAATLKFENNSISVSFGFL